MQSNNKSKNLSKNLWFFLLIATALILAFVLISGNGKKVSAKELDAPDTYMTISFGNAEISYHQQSPYISSTAYGMKITDANNTATTGSVKLNKPINLRSFGPNDYIAEILPVDSDRIYNADETDYIYNSMKEVRITLFDVADRTNYVYISYQYNVWQNYNYDMDHGGALAQGNTYVSVYTTGKVEALGSGADATTRCGFYGSKAAMGWDAGKLNPYSMRYDAENGVVYRARYKNPGDVGGHTLHQSFKGFSSDEVYVQVDFTFNAEKNGIIVKSLGGIDCSSSVAIDAEKPAVVENLPSESSVLTNYSLADISATDWFEGDLSDKFTFTLTKDGVSKTNYIKDNEIKFGETGEFVLTGSVSDSVGNTATFTKTINVYMPTLTVLSPFYGTYFTGETISPVQPVCNFDRIEYTATITDAKGKTSNFTGEYALNVAGEYKVKYSVTELYGNTSKEETFTVKVVELDISDIFLFAGQGVRDINFDFDTSIVNKSIKLYAKSDLANALPLTNIPEGEYVLVMTFTTEGREEEVRFERNLTVRFIPEVYVDGSYKTEYLIGESIAPLTLIVENTSSADYTVESTLYYNGDYSDFDSSVKLDNIGYGTVIYKVNFKRYNYEKLVCEDFVVVENSTPSSDKPTPPSSDKPTPPSPDKPTSKGCGGALNPSTAFFAAIIACVLILFIFIKKNIKKEQKEKEDI